MSVLTFSMILSIWRFCVSISLPMSRAMWRKLPMMPLTCSRFSSISFSRASFVTLGVKKQTQLFEAKREEIPLKLWLTPNLSCILPCLSAVGHATVLNFEKRGLLSSYPENLHMLIFLGAGINCLSLSLSICTVHSSAPKSVALWAYLYHLLRLPGSNGLSQDMWKNERMLHLDLCVITVWEMPEGGGTKAVPAACFQLRRIPYSPHRLGACQNIGQENPDPTLYLIKCIFNR